MNLVAFVYLIQLTSFDSSFHFTRNVGSSRENRFKALLKFPLSSRSVVLSDMEMTGSGTKIDS